MRRTLLRFIVLSMATVCLLQPAAGYQAPETSSTTTLPFPGGLTATVTLNKTQAGGVAWSAPAGTVGFNSFGGATSAMLSPANLPVTTPAQSLFLMPANCNLTAGTTIICANQGTVTVSFNREVTNPVLQLSGLGANQSGAPTNGSTFNSILDVQSFVGTGSLPTVTLLSDNSTFAASGSRIGNPVASDSSCVSGSNLAQCGSVRINGTFSSITFDVKFAIRSTSAVTAWNAISPGDGFNLTISVDEDFGDAPAALQGATVASHILGPLHLGASVTADNTTTRNGGALSTSPVANPSATGDTDDGVTLPAGDFVRGSTVQIPVTVTGTGGRLQGWIDWGRDNIFATTGDRIASNAIDGGAGDSDGTANGIITLSVPVPTGALPGTSFARFRLSTTDGLGPTELAPDGEVEDYQITIVSPVADLAITKTNGVTAVSARGDHELHPAGHEQRALAGHRRDPFRSGGRRPDQDRRGLFLDGRAMRHGADGRADRGRQLHAARPGLGPVL